MAESASNRQECLRPLIGIFLELATIRALFAYVDIGSTL